jgi:multiple sugar transport system substrate-binding protein
MHMIRIVLSLVVVCAFCSCTPRQGGEKTGDGRVVVQYWEKWTGFEGEAMQAVVDDFNASQNRIFVRMLTVSQIDQKLLLSTAGGNPPDVAGLWSHNIPDFAEKGALTPLDGRLAKAGFSADQYIPVIWNVCNHRDFTWALPTTPATVGLYWNKAMFREAGLDPDRPPSSLAELDALSEQLTIVQVERDGGPVKVPYGELTETERKAKRFDLFQIGHLPQEPGWWMGLWGYWFGGDLWDSDRAITADSPENIRAFHWFAGHAEKYGVDNLRKFGAANGNFSSPQNPFLAGRVAIVLQGVWMHNFIEKYAPHLEWGAASFPSVDPERLPMVTLAECDLLVIPRGAAHPDEAFEFIAYVNSQAALEKLALGQRKFSPLVDYSEDFVKRHPHPEIQLFIDLAMSPNARSVPRVSMWLEYRDEMQVAVDRVLALTATPEEALADVQKRVSWKFDRIMRRWDVVREQRLAEWRSYDTR